MATEVAMGNKKSYKMYISKKNGLKFYEISVECTCMDTKYNCKTHKLGYYHETKQVSWDISKNLCIKWSKPTATEGLELIDTQISL